MGTKTQFGSRFMAERPIHTSSTKNIWHPYCLLNMCQLTGDVKMVRNLVITAYILAILAISGFAKAETVSVNRLELIPQSYAVSVGGEYIAGCPMLLKAKVVEYNTSSDEVSLMLINSQDNFCTQVIEEPRQFDFVFDIRSLGLEPGRQYSFNIVNNTNVQFSNFDMYIPVSGWQGSLDQKVQHGHINKVDGQFILLLDRTRFLNLDSSLNLEPYIGQKVLVSGISLLDHLAPIEPISPKPSVFFVLNVSTY